MQKIRAKAVCLFRNNGKILLAEGHDPIKDEHYVLPLGGGIDFGELSQAAAEREVQEEISAATKDFSLLGVSENIFSYNGKPGHEIVFVYEARFQDESLYQQDIIHGIETNGIPIVTRWFDIDLLRSGEIKFYPHGIVDMI
ncbi:MULTISPECIES: NUDIX hydrolase [Pectobacterium]|uniref:NUDIX hydrolase n=1 Tax=Pectobacterium TaxID=122277 RepID=UPI00057C6647|nr:MULTISPECIES: NUDIX hydrolase [Pectobacterium]KHT30049.1 NUDIX hydrolase [Pectobacterium carotovorum subsp. carotovorum]MBA0179514.1 NUDIX hydrolase [Pectobacterium carotovorum]MBL0907978.1 NUDIX hydrolase [Pectobacterium carotovorum]MBN3197001.1 NUDIX hydrolase [Pectobacterium versatile]TAI92866.1 NUDIX domain-containing protein [Pectobacterium versatile]